MKNVYVVQHSYPVGVDLEFDETKMIGIFSTEEKAKKIVEEYKELPGFKDFSLECFYISKYELDEKCWSEGFVDLESGTE